MQVDGLNEASLARHKKGNKSLGTTKKGIGPAYGSKIMRNGEILNYKMVVVWHLIYLAVL